LNRSIKKFKRKAKVFTARLYLHNMKKAIAIAVSGTITPSNNSRVIVKAKCKPVFCRQSDLVSCMQLNLNFASIINKEAI